MEEFKQTFFMECGELLADLEERLSQLVPGEFDRDQMNAIFRAAHSIKGGSGAFGLDQMMKFTHAFEAMMDELREERIPLTQQAITAMLKASDIVTRMLEAAKAGETLPDEASADVLALLKSIASSGAAPAPAAMPSAPVATPADTSATTSFSDAESWVVSFRPKPGFFDNGSEPVLAMRHLSRLGETVITPDLSDLPSLEELDPESCRLAWTIRVETDVDETTVMDAFEFVTDLAEITLTRTGGATVEAVAEVPAAAAAPIVEQAPTVAAAAPAAPKPNAPAAPVSAATASIRVDLDRIDMLVNTVGELVITEAMLRAKLKNLPGDLADELTSGLDELSQHTRELQDSVMSIRMQPVKSVFSRMPRLVRDTATQLGKEIRLIMSGEGTEVDKTVIEQLNDPLTHMIRNSIDHGIESPEKRVENGKDAEGTIQLSAYQRSGRILIEIADDGAGINRSRVLSKAREKGLVADGAVLSDEEIDHLIFLPGFSTAEQVTSVSGRGVGMDVVRRNIETLGGTVRIFNRPGEGSTFTISLPLTLAILDGMIVEVGHENYIIPISSIIETLSPEGGIVHRVQGHGDMIDVRGEVVPLIYLHQVFGVPDAIQQVENALIVLVESGTQKLGLVVDELIGQQQVVIKSLEPNSDPVPGISSATILGDGKVSLILEINELKTLNARHRALQAA